MIHRIVLTHGRSQCKHATNGVKLDGCKPGGVGWLFKIHIVSNERLVSKCS